MAHDETPEMLADVLQTYELRHDGRVITRRIPGVINMRSGDVVRTLDRGDGSQTLRHAGDHELLLGRVVFALKHGQWPLGPLMSIDGDPANETPDNLIERDGLAPDVLAEIEDRAAARRKAAQDYELDAKRAEREAVAMAEAIRRDMDARRLEGDAQTSAVAAMWSHEEVEADAEADARVAARVAAAREALASERAAEAAYAAECAAEAAEAAEPAAEAAEPLSGAHAAAHAAVAAATAALAAAQEALNIATARANAIEDEPAPAPRRRRSLAEVA